MRSLARAGRWAGGVLLGLAGLLLALLWRPEWFLTPPVLTELTVHFGKPYHLQWQDYALAIHSRSFRRKELTLKTRGFCLRDSTGTLRGCFDRVDAGLTVELGLPPRLVELDHLDVDGRSLTLDETKAPPRPKKRQGASGFQSLSEVSAALPRGLRELRLRELDVKLPKTRLVTASTSTLEGDLSLSYSTAQSPPLALAAKLYYDTPEKGENLDVRLAVDSDLFTKGRLTFLRAVGRLKGDVEDSASFDARLDQKTDERMTLTAKARAVSGARRLRADVSGAQTGRKLEGRLTADILDSSGTIRELIVRSCDVKAPLDEQRRLRQLTLDCRMTAEPKPLGKAPGKAESRVAVRLGLDARLQPKLGAPDRFDATLTASIGPVKDWFEFSARLKARLEGRLSQLPRSLESRHDVDATLRVPDFKDVVAYMKDTAYAIPAPLHVLEGPVDADFKSKGDTSKPDQVFTYTARTNLSSGRQKVVVKVDGRVLAKQLFTPGRRFEDTTEVELQDVALELPYLKLGSVPPLTVDPRIRTGERPEQPPEPAPAPAPPAARAGRTAVAASTSSVSYLAHIATVKPIVVYTNLNPSPIPVSVDLRTAGAGVSGKVTIEPFVAQIVRREADIDHVTFTLNPGAKQTDLDGLIGVKMPDADVSIKLLGTTDKPQLVFESDPPMAQQDIVAMLLFGKSPSDLDPDQKTTASNSQSAMATGAFGFASLYLFASTPIQYVGYDPSTQSYAMKFSLPGGASLEVGSSAQQQSHLTLRKRLARHWVISTEYQRTGAGAPTTTSSQQNAVTTFLEWFQRY